MLRISLADSVMQVAGTKVKLNIQEGGTYGSHTSTQEVGQEVVILRFNGRTTIETKMQI